MCDRTVDGTDRDGPRTVSGADGDYRTVSGSNFGWRNVTGINLSTVVLAGTRPIVTRRNAAGPGTFTTAANCVYFQVYAIGGNGGGAGGGVDTNTQNGGGGGAGGCAVGFFVAGTYSYVIGDIGAAGGIGANGGAGGDTTFATLTAKGGGGGYYAGSGSFDAPGATNGGTINSVLPIGNIPAIGPGKHGSNAGSNAFLAQYLENSFSDTLDIDGYGGGGGNRSALGASGSRGQLLIIQYF